ncbi:hypothetical protein ACTJJ7_00015 [Phyllobacterium sp. 22229]|uniref:hypothetical protein n=1 Tax=Phyllobacterium sp. 22229 TaxID=3453895 RepID=UPI003F831FC2
MKMVKNIALTDDALNHLLSNYDICNINKYEDANYINVYEYRGIFKGGSSFEDMLKYQSKLIERRGYFIFQKNKKFFEDANDYVFSYFDNNQKIFGVRVSGVNPCREGYIGIFTYNEKYSYVIDYVDGINLITSSENVSLIAEMLDQVRSKYSNKL